MKTLLRYLPLVAVLVAGSVHAQVQPPFSEDQACSAGSCTRAAVPAAANEGVELSGATGYRVSVCASAGQTLSGAGSMSAWRLNYASGTWDRDPDLDFLVTASGARCQAFPDVSIGAVLLKDRVIYTAVGVTVSGGAALTVWIVPSGGRK
jgi:hypothetical protein